MIWGEAHCLQTSFPMALLHSSSLGVRPSALLDVYQIEGRVPYLCGVFPSSPLPSGHPTVNIFGFFKDGVHAVSPYLPVTTSWSSEPPVGGPRPASMGHTPGITDNPDFVSQSPLGEALELRKQANHYRSQRPDSCSSKMRTIAWAVVSDLSTRKRCRSVASTAPSRLS